MASRVSLDLPYWAMRSAPYHLIGMAIEMASKGGAFLSVINFGVKNQVVALWKSPPEASVKKARNGPSTQLIKATSCIKMSNAAMKEEELS